MGKSVDDLYCELNPLFQKMGSLGVSSIYKVVEQFIDDHIDKEDSRYSGLFRCGEKYLTLNYMRQCDFTDIRYSLSWYDSLKVRISCFSAVIEYKAEHFPQKTLLKMEFDRFYELYVRPLCNE